MLKTPEQEQEHKDAFRVPFFFLTHPCIYCVETPGDARKANECISCHSGRLNRRFFFCKDPRDESFTLFGHWRSDVSDVCRLQPLAAAFIFEDTRFWVVLAKIHPQMEYIWFFFFFYIKKFYINIMVNIPWDLMKAVVKGAQTFQCKSERCNFWNLTKKFNFNNFRNLKVLDQRSVLEL